MTTEELVYYGPDGNGQVAHKVAEGRTAVIFWFILIIAAMVFHTK